MIHQMKIQPKYFEAIQNGTKIYEIRLNDEKRKLIQKGDTIEFLKEPDKVETLIVDVEGVLYFKNFEEMLEKIQVSKLAPADISKIELLQDLESYYSKEKQKEYGVVAIQVKRK